MGVEIRACASPEEMRQAITPIGYYFGRTTPNADQAERLTRVMSAQRLYAAWEDDRSNSPFMPGDSLQRDVQPALPTKVITDDV